MNTALIGGTASFLGGVSAALLLSYPIPDHCLYVGFVAIFVALGACLLAAWAIVLHCTRSERVRAERVVQLTVDRMLEQRGLELVSDP